MTLPSVIRIFFAIDLPPSVKDKVMQMMKALKKQSRTHSIRWTKPDNLHITFQFLAEVNAEHLPNLITKVRHQVEAINKNLSFMFGNIELFPDLYRPRVIVLDLAAQDDLAELSRLIG